MNNYLFQKEHFQSIFAFLKLHTSYRTVLIPAEHVASFLLSGDKLHSLKLLMSPLFLIIHFNFLSH